MCFSTTLRVEACYFCGVLQPFPNHSHDYYVIGCLEDGMRHMVCQNSEYRLRPGDLLIFTPGDNHACTTEHGKALTYRSFHVGTPILQELSGRHDAIPRFVSPVIDDPRLFTRFVQMHERVMRGDHGASLAAEFKAILQSCLRRHGAKTPLGMLRPTPAVEKACTWMRSHYAEPVTLDALSALTGMNRSALVRAFVRCTGITPYRYVETLRIGRARTLLEGGMEPAMVALETGFADQSHFGRFFKQRLGLTPKQYQSVFDPVTTENMEEKQPGVFP